MSNQSIVAKVALPYAEALLDSAQAANSVQKTSEDLSVVNQLLSESTELRLFLENPIITSLSKKKLLTTLLLNQISDFVLKFLLVLIDRRRITILGNIIQKYLDLAYKLDSIIIAEVFTATAFSELQELSLKQKLKSVTNSKEIKLIMIIDSSLIGGFIVKIGSKVIDTSLSGKLKKMSFYLSNSLN